jgi:hypothetical protein
MSYIKVDSRGCGVGKTRNTIIPRIRNNIQSGIRTLIVVPSINLQKEYAEHFSWDEITIINRDDNKEKILQQYQLADTPVVCLTHQGFLQVPTDYFEKTNTDLIIDEAFDPYSMITFKTYDSAGRVWVDFCEIFAWLNPALVPKSRPKTTFQEFYELTVVESTPPDIIDNERWRKIANPNWRLWATWEIGNNLMTGASETSTIGLELSESILDNWSSVWIAAAAFEKTFMGYWMQRNAIPYEIEYEFQTHDVLVNWHIPTEEFSWSKGCKTANPDIEGIFRDYCEQHRSGRLIYNSNNDSTTAFVHGDKLSHNAHGINAYKDRTDYAFMSAIQPNAVYKNFLWQRCGFDDREDCRRFAFAFSGYTAYQLIMRSALRDPSNTLPVNIFALDTTMILEVMDLFNLHRSTVFTNIPVEDSRVKKKPLTSAERQRLYRLRKKAQTNT